MKFLMLLHFPIHVFATTLVLPSDISQVVTHDGAYEAKYSNGTRNRFIVKNALGGEGYQSIQVEKYAPGKIGNTDTIIQSKSFEVPSLPKVKEAIALISKKSPEAVYGCCGVADIKWNNSGWSFVIQQGKKSFRCQISEIDSKEPKATCL